MLKPTKIQNLPNSSTRTTNYFPLFIRKKNILNEMKEIIYGNEIILCYIVTNKYCGRKVEQKSCKQMNRKRVLNGRRL